MGRSSTTPFANMSRRDRATLRDLMICATAVATRTDRMPELRALLDATPIDALPHASRLHRVAGSVRRGLLRVGDLDVPVMDELAACSTRTALRHLGFVGALSEVADRFAEAGVRWVVMKGPVLASCYPDVGDRAYSDLDLLVDRRDFPVAVDVLEQLGYGHSIRNWALAEAVLASQIVVSRGWTRFDVQWHLHYARVDRRNLAFRPEDMIERARMVDVSGVSIPTLDSIDTLLTVAFHAARSDGHALVWAKDIERLVAVEQPDFDELVRRCRESRCGPQVGIMLDRSRQLLGADVPADVVTELVPSKVLAAHRCVSRVSHPIRLHDRSTIARFVTRSVSSSGAESIRSVPARGVRRLKRELIPGPVNETDDPFEKSSYLRAVVASYGL